MVGEQIVQFTFEEVEREKQLRTNKTLVSLGLVGEAHSVSDVCYGKDCGVVTNSLIDQISTFGTHTEPAEVEDGKAQ
ncbi:hypothetical protein pEaSNUABM54_00246 [Erwinia phage pEa_SNUABM_54]|nr:hypothetical protein pEaSNUABM54_00246 [Erwinia phage pEa_SNUABM_54]